ncbi:MAG TPA: hydroxyacid dehydrogenase [Aestuariivirgaceae bacterium]|jgi:D-3-phosphoglycerate dehydrogenase
MARVVIVGNIHKSGLDLLKKRQGLDVRQEPALEERQMRQAVRDADAILIRTSVLSKEAINGASKLKIVARHGVGYDNIDMAALNERRIPLALVGNVNSVSVAEHTLYLLLACIKQGIAYDRAVREGRWTIRDTLGARDLKGKALLLVGLGRIGLEVARRAKALGLKILAYDPWIKQNSIEEKDITFVAELDRGLAEADVVSLHLPLTAETRRLFDKENIGKMKEGAVLICTARGGLIDENALAEALQEGRLAGAGLDVFEDEPPPSGHRLLHLSNVVLSPHSAALTEECAERMAIISAQNCLDGLDGRLDPALVANRQVLGGE